MIIRLKGATFTTNIGTLDSWSIKYTTTNGSVTKKSGANSIKKDDADGEILVFEFDTAKYTYKSGTIMSNDVSAGTIRVSGNTITVNVNAGTTLGGKVEINFVMEAVGGGEPAGNGALGLPTTYQAVEYLETDGTQYFVFSGEKVSSNVSYEIKFAAAKVTNSQGLIGSYSATAEAERSQIRLSSQKDNSGVAHNGLEWMYGSQGSVEKATVTDTQISAQYWTGINTLKVDANKLYWNDTLLKTYNEETFTISQTDFTLFAQNNNNAAGNGGYGRQASVKCYFVKIADTTNNINRELVPCYRVSDNVIGFYDTVNSEFIIPTAGTITSKGSIISA